MRRSVREGASRPRQGAARTDERRPRHARSSIRQRFEYACTRTRDPVRRLRHALVASVAPVAAEAIPAPRRRPQPFSGNGAAHPRDRWRDRARRSSSATKPIVSSSRSSCASSKRRRKRSFWSRPDETPRPAVAVAALLAQQAVGKNDEPVLAVLPADHVITRAEAFGAAVADALEAAAAAAARRVRRRAGSAGDRLRLHTARRGTSALVRPRQVRRKTGPRDRRTLRVVGTVPVEQRDVRLRRCDVS